MKARFPLRSILAGVGCGVLLAAGSTAADPDPDLWDKYLWQTCRTTDLAPSSSNLVTELRVEMQKIFDAGPLAPVRTVYADLEQDPYFMYWQGGRIITTLAMAWPHLDRKSTRLNSSHQIISYGVFC